MACSGLSVRSVVAIGRPMYPASAALFFYTEVVENVPGFSVDTTLLATSVVRLFSVLSALPLMATVVYQFVKARRAKDARLISVTRSLIVAAIGGLFIPLVANTTVRMLGIEGGFAHQVTAIAVLLFAVTTAMTLVRHNPLEIDRYAASVVGYVVTLSGLGGVFGPCTPVLVWSGGLVFFGGSEFRHPPRPEHSTTPSPTTATNPTSSARS